MLFHFCLSRSIFLHSYQGGPSIHVCLSTFVQSKGTLYDKVYMTRCDTNAKLVQIDCTSSDLSWIPTERCQALVWTTPTTQRGTNHCPSPSKRNHRIESRRLVDVEESRRFVLFYRVYMSSNNWHIGDIWRRWSRSISWRISHIHGDFLVCFP